jgi:hypothetical protein
MMSSFLREAGTAVFLAMLTLCLQCAGMAALISFAKPRLAPGDLRLGPIRSALVMVRLMAAFIVLHISAQSPQQNTSATAACTCDV